MKRIMLLGSGELGKEFVISAKRLGCYVIAVDSYENAPAMQLSDKSVVINMLDPSKLRQEIDFWKPDIVVPEIEAIATEVLSSFESDGMQIVPSAFAAQATMNRDRIRDLASGMGIRTARFAYAESAEDLAREAGNIGYPVVVKPVMSSSGKGQSVVTSAEGIFDAWVYAMENKRGTRPRVIVEEFIRFHTEITLLTIKQRKGPTLFCNPIGHVQERGDYQYSWQSSDPLLNGVLTEHQLAEAKRVASLVTNRLGGAGLFGVEFFVTDDDIIFSELSPRPHDTGMVTLISQDLSEFDLHIRAVLGYPIHGINHRGGASAVVLGETHGRVRSYQGLESALQISGIDVRIFGKEESRPYRRMGVVLGWNLEDARAAAGMIKVIT